MVRVVGDLSLRPAYLPVRLLGTFVIFFVGSRHTAMHVAVQQSTLEILKRRICAAYGQS